MASESIIGLDPIKVQLALRQCLSLNNEERKQAFDYLSACENNSEFPLILLECFLSTEQGNSNMKLDSLIYLKNTISRRWSQAASKHLFKSSMRILI